jgi:transcriptional regulator with XRE-family HTH domain
MPTMPPKPRQPPSDATVEFGKRVRALREQQALSQEALADRCGVHWTFLGQVERGQRSIRLDNILRVAAGLGVQPGELLDALPGPALS